MLIPSLVLLSSFSAYANSSGRINSSVAGCGGACHTGGSAPTVSLTAPATTVSAGSSTNITFRVDSSAPTVQTGAGLNVSATGGTLSAGTGTRVSSGEITHSSTGVADAAGAVAWTFSWTAPATAGTYTLRAAGNSVNRNGVASGDASAVTQLVLTVTSPCVDHDIDGVTTCAGDCNDANASIKPGVAEVCDSVDQDCDGVVDESPLDGDVWYFDADGDGFGTPDSFLRSCDVLEEYVENALDCDDDNPFISPSAVERCDDGDFDEDCDDLVNDADDDATGGSLFYADLDGDGHGAGTATPRCQGGSGWVTSGEDCDDADAAEHLCLGDTDTDDTDTDTDDTDPETDSDVSDTAADSGIASDTDVSSGPGDSDVETDVSADSLSATDSDSAAPLDGDAADVGCGCSPTPVRPAATGWLAVAGLAWLTGRRRRPAR